MLKEEFIKSIKNKGLNELEQEYAILDAKIKELKEQQGYIKAMLDKGAEPKQVKEKIIDYINQGLSNKEISNHLPDTAESYIRQVRSDYLGNVVKKKLYKEIKQYLKIYNSLDKDNIINLLALDIYHKKPTSEILIEYEGILTGYNAKLMLLPFIERVYKYYKNPSFIELPNDKNVSEFLQFKLSTTVPELKTYLVNYFNNLDEHYIKAKRGLQIKKEQEQVLPEIVANLMMSIGRLPENDFTRLKSNLKQNYKISDSYFNGIMYILNGLIKLSKSNNIKEVNINHLFKHFKSKTKLANNKIKTIMLHSGLLDPNVLDSIEI